ncbi:MAG: peptidase T [Alistipes finegoldii]|nr:peptidase T [Alistipes finegoldii]
MQVEQRLLKYVSYWTTSDENNMADGKIQIPSTERQFDLGKVLEQELRDLGLKNVVLTDHCYVYGLLPATAGCEGHKAVGFISHMDTAPDYSGKDVKPQIIPDYDGGDVRLNGTGAMLKVSDFPTLKDLKGRTLITTDGTTLLGADDKAGVAEIVTALEEIISSGMPHGDIWVGFTPDEEIGCGADLFDLDYFKAAFAYTVDGGMEGELEYENFNAASAKIDIQGRNVHPGYAKDKMINAIEVACDLQRFLPACQRPEHTEGYEGFYHCVGLNGTVEKASVSYIIRDHDADKFEQKKVFMWACVDLLKKKYGDEVLTLTVKDQYFNMRKMVEPHPQVIDKALEAMERAGVKPLVRPIRGGTDGARLSFMGLPCPNLFTGGMNFHGKFEYCSLTTMRKAQQVILNLAQLWAE